MLIYLFLIGCSEYELNATKSEPQGVDDVPVETELPSEDTDVARDTDTEVEDECVPTGEEFCDGVDNNCDGNIDEGNALDASTWYADADDDGYGSTDTVTACAPPLGYVSDTSDCDDANVNVHPGAEEICDWIVDNNCDGVPFLGDLDGSYDGNGDGDYDDEGEQYERSEGTGDGFTWCFQYHAQIDNDGDGYCDRGVDNNGDGDCIDEGDIIYPEDVYAPDSVIDCDVTDPSVYPGHGC